MPLQSNLVLGLRKPMGSGAQGMPTAKGGGGGGCRASAQLSTRPRGARRWPRRCASWDTPSLHPRLVETPCAGRRIPLTRGWGPRQGAESPPLLATTLPALDGACAAAFGKAVAGAACATQARRVLRRGCQKKKGRRGPVGIGGWRSRGRCWPRWGGCCVSRGWNLPLPASPPPPCAQLRPPRAKRRGGAKRRSGGGGADGRRLRCCGCGRLGIHHGVWALCGLLWRGPRRSCGRGGVGGAAVGTVAMVEAVCPLFERPLARAAAQMGCIYASEASSSSLVDKYPGARSAGSGWSVMPVSHIITRRPGANAIHGGGSPRGGASYRMIPAKKGGPRLRRPTIPPTAPFRRRCPSQYGWRPWRAGTSAKGSQGGGGRDPAPQRRRPGGGGRVAQAVPGAYAWNRGPQPPPPIPATRALLGRRQSLPPGGGVAVAPLTSLPPPPPGTNRSHREPLPACTTSARDTPPPPPLWVVASFGVGGGGRSAQRGGWGGGPPHAYGGCHRRRPWAAAARRLRGDDR